jgi:phosphoserine phosphatase
MANRITPKLTFVLAQADRKAFDVAMGAVPEGKSATLLSENKACDFILNDIDTNTAPTEMQDIRHAYLAELERLGIAADICVQDSKTARKSLLICDMDSTLIGQECIDELADFAGVKDRVSAITERAMRGEIGFEGALEERVGLLEGLDLSVLQKCFDERISLNPGARTLCQTMKANGAVTAIVSGGFTFFTSRVAKLCGFKSDQANTLIEKDGKLTGKVGYPILGREAKYDALIDHSNNNPNDAVAIGDGANDLAMIEASGLGIAYYAKPAVAAAAHCAINHTDLTSALYFQGYKDADFKTD